MLFVAYEFNFVSVIKMFFLTSKVGWSVFKEEKKGKKKRYTKSNSMHKKLNY